MMPATFCQAVISDDEKYRYLLTRTWDYTLDQMTLVMLNPSTADATVDDPTIRRCMGFARREGCGGIRVVNLFAYRATNPAELRRAIDPVGPENNRYLSEEFALAATCRAPLVAAWGSYNDIPFRVREVTKFLDDIPDRVFSLGTNANGSPKHPLYIRADQPLIPWPA